MAPFDGSLSHVLLWLFGQECSVTSAVAREKMSGKKSSRISMQSDPKPKPALAPESGRLDELLDQHTTIGFDHPL